MRFVLVVLAAWILLGSVFAIVVGRAARILRRAGGEPMAAPAVRRQSGDHEGELAELTYPERQHLRFTEAGLDELYTAEGFGGELTVGAKVIRALIDEIRLLRAELVEAERSTA